MNKIAAFSATTTVNERLETIFNQLLSVYERQTQERQSAIKEKEEIHKLIELLINQTKEFGKYEEGIRKRIQASIAQSAEVSFKTIEEAIIEKNSENLNTTHQQVSTIYESVNEISARYNQDKNYRLMLFILIAIFSSILSSLLIIKFLMPEPTLPLSDQQITYLHEGQILEKIWPKLTDKEQQKIEFLAEK